MLFAGNTGNGKVGKERERMLKRLAGVRLFSYFWAGEGKEFFHLFREWIEKKEDKQV